MFCCKHDYDSYCSLVVAPSLLLAFTCPEYVLYLCFQPPKTNIASCVHHTYLLASFAISVHIPYVLFSSKIKCLSVLRKLVSKALTNLMAHFIFFALNNIEPL